MVLPVTANVTFCPEVAGNVRTAIAPGVPMLTVVDASTLVEPALFGKPRLAACAVAPSVAKSASPVMPTSTRQASLTAPAERLNCAHTVVALESAAADNVCGVAGASGNVRSVKVSVL